MGRNLRLQSCKRFWSSRSAKGSSKEEESGKEKATFKMMSSSLSFFLEKQNLIFLWCGSCYSPFSPKTILFSQDFAWSVLCLVAFKTSSSCAMPCWRVLPLRHLEHDFASTQRIDASCLCWQSFPLVFTHRLAMKVPVVISLCLVVFKPAKQLRIAMLESVAIATSVASFLTLNTCK